MCEKEEEKERRKKQAVQTHVTRAEEREIDGREIQKARRAGCPVERQRKKRRQLSCEEPRNILINRKRRRQKKRGAFEEVGVEKLTRESSHCSLSLENRQNIDGFWDGVCLCTRQGLEKRPKADARF